MQQGYPHLKPISLGSILYILMTFALDISFSIFNVYR